MNRISTIALVTAAVLVGCAAGVVAHEYVAPPAVAQAPAGITQYEHLGTNLLWEELDSTPFKAEYGAQGFELVSVVHAMKPGMMKTTEIYACFKRQVVYQ